MNAKIIPSPLRGTVAAIPSKSQAQRLLLCTALGDREAAIECPALCGDIEAMVRCLRALGANITYDGRRFTVRPLVAAPETAILPVGESGAVLRFLLPVVGALGVRASFLMEGRLARRPLEPLWSALAAHGMELTREGNTIHTAQRLTGREFALAGNVSSQFLSGILMALPLLGGGRLRVDGEIESEAYVRMTMDVLNRVGQGESRFAVEGDWSSAAFWLCAGIPVTGLCADSLQVDACVPECMENIRRGNAVISCAQTPDLAPPLAVLAAASPGMTRFIHAERLRMKESDRIAAIVTMLRALGVRAAESEDGFTVEGGRICGGRVDSFGDHRLVMAAAIAAIKSEAPVTIVHAEAVKKSYPHFFEDFRSLGGRVHFEEGTA